MEYYHLLWNAHDAIYLARCVPNGKYGVAEILSTLVMARSATTAGKQNVATVELGLLRKRSVSSPGQNKHKRIKVSGQIFQYIIVLDFESTCWHDTKLIPQEIIEFPAVLMNTSNGKIESEFHYYVQPQEKPVLSDFCCELTGISQKQVDDGIPLHLCLKLFTQWLEKLYKEKNIQYFSAPEQNFNLCTFVTWSDWDLNLCLKNECRRKQLRKPPELNQWVDLRATYKKFYDRKPDGLNGALKDLGIVFQGREHSGVDDARNTACLAWRMIQDGCVLKITKILPGVPKHVSLAKTPIIKEMPKSRNGAQASRLDNGNLGKHKVSGTPVPTQGPNQGEKTNTSNKNPHPRPRGSIVPLDKVKQFHRDAVRQHKFPQCISIDRIERSCEVDDRTVGTVARKQNCEGFGRYIEQTDSPIVGAHLLVTFLKEWQQNSVSPVIRNSLCGPHCIEDPVKPRSEDVGQGLVDFRRDPSSLGALLLCS
ncbi:ERI2 [Acanthosepion pharaonis]|uniref:ERI2 n=1 Tax=Acanthosepion pharaonis TaxID=158019 RepID=A0A812E8X0_ACAPH|nr:ERI2 [Sepia pharaonis]